MKSILKVIAIIFIISFFLPSFAQEQSKTTAPASGIQPEKSATQKAQNNNTVRSNRSESKAAIDQTGNQDDNNAVSSKKGYDYYKAKSELNSAGQTKAQDHNSTRSNKTASVVAPNNPDTGGNPDEKPILSNDKTDKSEAARAKKK